MATYKHLSLKERLKIEALLKEGRSFKSIGSELNPDCTTISKEIKCHMLFKRNGAYSRSFNNCLYRNTCTRSFICDKPRCKLSFCKSCSLCLSVCKDFIEEKCHKLLKSPYVCNSCSDLIRCRLEKRSYSALDAQKEYVSLCSEARSGISACEDELRRLDSLISPLIMKGQSIHHICSNNKDSIMCSEKTIYNYTDYNLFSARNISLPRKVKYRPRKTHKDRFKVDKSCRIGRTYEDFKTYMALYPDTPVVEMDSVEGTKGGKVLLTIHFRESEFMLAFIRDSNTSQSVIDIFDRLYLTLSPDVFDILFPVILTDNGSEFSNPKAIEFDTQGNRRAMIFYCDPSSPYQKGAIENNHEQIRRIIPKGKSFNNLTQDDIDLIMGHVNSYGRKKLNTQSPHQVFSLLYGVDTLNKLGAILIQPNDIVLKPELIKK